MKQQPYTRPHLHAFRRWLVGFVVAVLAVGTFGASPASAYDGDVRQLQMDLATLDYLEYWEVDGYYGARTAAAVTLFQRHNCLDDDGDAGFYTRFALSVKIAVVQRKASPALPWLWDGYGGPTTTKQIRLYQENNGIYPTAQADGYTMYRMGVQRVRFCPF